MASYKKVHPAMIAVWAALISVSGLLPTFPVFGTGGNFSVGYTLAPIAGIMFGPFAGALSVAIGEFIGSIIAPHVATLGLFTFIINTTNAFAAGYLSRKNWYVCFGIIAALTVVWFLIPSGRAAYVYSLVYLAGMVAAPIGGILGSRLFDRDNVLIKTIGVFLMSWPAYIAGSIMGNIPTLFLVELPAELWNTFLVWVTPFERTVFAIGAAIIGTPLLIGLPKIGIFVGPQYDGEEIEDELDKKIAAKVRSKM
ncbi:MAG: ECF transporter S component [Zhaonellaceae bacterium]